MIETAHQLNYNDEAVLHLIKATMPSEIYGTLYCYIVGLGLNCKFIDLLFKRSIIKSIKISSLLGFIVPEIIYSQTDTLTLELMKLR